MTDQELAAKLAQVMGWEAKHFFDDMEVQTYMDGNIPKYDVDNTYGDGWFPLINKNHIWMVVERFLSKGWFFRVYMDPNGVIIARFWFVVGISNTQEGRHEGDNLCHAIAEAAIKAWEAK